jgi:hypothetical protein
MTTAWRYALMIYSCQGPGQNIRCGGYFFASSAAFWPSNSSILMHALGMPETYLE